MRILPHPPPSSGARRRGGLSARARRAQQGGRSRSARGRRRQKRRTGSPTEREARRWRREAKRNSPERSERVSGAGYPRSGWRGEQQRSAGVPVRLEEGPQPKRAGPERRRSRSGVGCARPLLMCRPPGPAGRASRSRQAEPGPGAGRLAETALAGSAQDNFMSHFGGAAGVSTANDQARSRTASVRRRADAA